MNEQVRQQDAGGAGSAPLWMAAVLLLAGVVGYYLLGDSNAWLRWGSVVAGLVVGALVFFLSPAGRELQILDQKKTIIK